MRIARDDRGALDELIARRREEASFWHGANPVSGPSDTLKATAIERGDPIWQTRSTVPMSMPSSSERRRDNDAGLAGFEALFGGKPDLPRKTAMMSGDRILSQSVPQAFLKMMRYPFYQSPRIHKDQRRSMLDGSRSASRS